MPMAELILALDQGTTGSTAAFFRADTLTMPGNCKVEFPQHYPKPGWVEHDPEEIWRSMTAAIDAAWAAAQRSDASLRLADVRAIGITNQRETIVAWNRRTGETAGRALVWQDRRTADFCAHLAGDEAVARRIRESTGLVIDPYFSASKMHWILAHYPQVKGWALNGELALGTIDAWLIYRLTGGAAFVTEHTNASRTMLYSLEQGGYDPELARIFGVPLAALPEVRPSVGTFGVTRGVPQLPDGIPITGCLGDQQAALFGQGCERAGEGKITYGTGAFFLMNTGAEPVFSARGLLTSVAFSEGAGRTFALEGSTFIAGAAVQFLRDNFGWFTRADESESLALSEPRDPGVLFIPALAGLGAPYWNPHARGALFGLTRGTSRAQITRAVLESITLQIVQLVRVMQESFTHPIIRLGVDGGAARSDLMMQLQSDLLRVRLVRPANIETTSLGAARAALRGIDPAHVPPATTGAREFEPRMPADEAATIVSAWTRAAEAVHGFYRPA